MKKSRKKAITHEKPSPLILRLYVANSNPRSQLARANLSTFCERYLERGYRVQIIDIVRDPESAFQNDILATPTLVRVQPCPQKTVIGALSDPSLVLRALDLPEQAVKSQSIRFIQSAGEA